MAHNRIDQATTEPFVSCDCVTIVDIVSFVRTSQKLPDDGLPNFFVNVDFIVNFAKLNSLQLHVPWNILIGNNNKPLLILGYPGNHKNIGSLF